MELIQTNNLTDPNIFDFKLNNKDINVSVNKQFLSSYNIETKGWFALLAKECLDPFINFVMMQRRNKLLQIFMEFLIKHFIDFVVSLGEAIYLGSEHYLVAKYIARMLKCCDCTQNVVVSVEKYFLSMCKHTSPSCTGGYISMINDKKIMILFTDFVVDKQINTLNEITNSLPLSSDFIKFATNTKRHMFQTTGITIYPGKTDKQIILQLLLISNDSKYKHIVGFKRLIKLVIGHLIY